MLATAIKAGAGWRSVLRATLPTAIIVLAGLAGCFGTDDPEPTAPVDARGFPLPSLLCHPLLDAAQASLHVSAPDGMRCNFEMTPDEGRQGNEVTIAVNPTDPRNVVGGAKDYYPADAGECVWDGVYVTHDGGRSEYQDRSFDGSPWRLETSGGEGFTPNYASQFWCTTDPVAYFDVNGNLYYLLMAYQADRVSGSKAGEEEGQTCQDLTGNPACEAWPGALNDWAFNRATQIIAVSDDGGDSFHTFTPVLEGTFPVNFHDKGWIAASADGTIHVMWLAFFVPGNQYCRSTDGGQTYLCKEIIAVQFLEAGQGSFLEVGTGSEVYASWYSGGIRLKRSFDTGDTWDENRVVVDAQIADMPGLSGRDRRSISPMMATDRNPESPFGGAIYFVWQDQRDGGASVWFAASHDQGETFTDPIRISEPWGPAGPDYEVFPAVSVSPGGVIDVSWMDTGGARMVGCPEDPGTSDAHCDGEYHTFEQKYAYSLDGGKTWSSEFNVRDAGDGGWDPALSHHQNGVVFIGDYNDIDSSWQAAHPVWPDTRSGEVVDVYTATIQRPMFAEGWSEEARQLAQEEIAKKPL